MSAGLKPLETTQIDINLKIASAFDGMGVSYFICGSTASSLYGFARSAMAVDFVAELHTTDAPRLVTELGDEFYAVESAIRDAIAERRSFIVIHLDSMLKIDAFVLKQDRFSREQMARRKLVPVSAPPAPEIYFASPEDTVISKLDWYRKGGEISDRQWNDILGVLKVQAERLDVEYMKKWAEELNVADLLDRALDDAGLE